MSREGEHALMLAASVAVAGGPRLRVAGKRAYFPGGDYVMVGPRGDVTAVRRGQATFTEESLSPRWRKGWRDGLGLYVETLSPSARAENPVSIATVTAAINLATQMAGRSRKPSVVSAAEYQKAVEVAEAALGETTEDAVYGCGDFGCAAQLAGRDGILKVTTDHEEQMAVAAVVRYRAEQGFARIWKGPVVLDAFPGMVWPWSAYTREVVLVTERQAPYGAWNILRELDQARMAGREGDYLLALSRLWRFGKKHPPMRGIAETCRTLWQNGYMLGDFHAGNYGERDGVFVLFDAKVTLREPKPPRKHNPTGKKRPRSKLPAGIKDWFSVYGPKGAPREGERGHVDPIPFDLKQAIASVWRIWRDPEGGPMVQELLASEGYVEDYGGDLLEPEDRMFAFDELPSLVGVDASPEDVAYLFGKVAESVEDIDEDELDAIPMWLEIGIVHDALSPEAKTRPRLINVPKDEAEAYINEHHQQLDMKDVGLMYSLGVVVDGRLVAVATAGTPSGAFRSRDCGLDGILELSRIASDQSVLGASSMLASRVLDLVPRSGRRGLDGCLFVTYSLFTEAGTTYLALADKGLRPVGIRPGTKPTGARRGAGDSALRSEPKIIWEGGPAARAPDWGVLEKTRATEKQIASAMDCFYKWDKRERKAGRGLQVAYPASKKRTRET
jgi:hypothetical protein